MPRCAADAVYCRKIPVAENTTWKNPQTKANTASAPSAAHLFPCNLCIGDVSASKTVTGVGIVWIVSSRYAPWKQEQVTRTCLKLVQQPTGGKTSKWQCPCGGACCLPLVCALVVCWEEPPLLPRAVERVTRLKYMHKYNQQQFFAGSRLHRERKSWTLRVKRKNAHGPHSPGLFLTPRFC